MKRKGQSTLEYAILIAVVVGAFLIMRYYMTRGVQGKLRESADSIGDQYSAGKTTSTYTTVTKEMQTNETFGTTKKGVSHYEVVKPAEVTRTAVGGDAEQTQSLSSETLFTP